MSQLPMMPVFPDALVADTMHLSAEEFGCYCLILFATWRNNGKPFSDEHDLAHICRVPIRRWRSHMRDRLSCFFNLSENTWRQERLEKEWAKSTAKAEVSRQNGRAGRVAAGPRATGDLSVDPLALFQPASGSPIQNREVSKNLDLTVSPRANGHDLEEKSENGSFGSLRSPARAARLGSVKKDLLEQKLMRFANATMRDADRHAAFVGLLGEDPEHSRQWWFDQLDLAMRAKHWDDAT